MPSLLDLLATADEDDLTAPEPPAALIDSVKADGSRRRAHRHRRNLGVAILALAFLAVPTTLLRSGDGGGEPEISVAAGGDSTPSSEVIEPVEPGEATAVTQPTSVPADGPPPPPAPGVPPEESTPQPTTPPGTTAPTTAPAGPAPPPATTPTTALACRNSDNQACGEFRWDPAPAPNQPLVASFTKAPATTVVVGQKVDFEVSWSDGDARLQFHHIGIDSGMAQACSMMPRYGPWTPPPPAPGSGTLPFSHTFQQAGTFKVVATLGTSDCTSPYGNDLLIDTTVTVVETG